MLTRIREVRRARGLTLDDVARRCIPPTTPQTLGRLETGTRTVSIRWLQRIASAMAVEPHDLLPTPKMPDLKVVAVLGQEGAHSPSKEAIIVPPRVRDNEVAVLVSGSLGEYRAGDELWCEILNPENFGRALNRDVLVPRQAGRFLFGRLINRDSEKLHVLRLDSGGRQQVVPLPASIAIVRKIIRSV